MAPKGPKPHPNYKGTGQFTPAMARAAVLIAENRLNYTRVAEELGVSSLTLANWRTRDDVQAAIRDHVETLQHETSTLHYSDRNRRIAGLNTLAVNLDQVMSERGEWYNDLALASPDGKLVPGGRTGLIVRQRRMIGTGPKAEIIEEDMIDRALISEYKDTLIQIAKERGEWSDKRELSGPGGAPLLPIKEIIVNLPADADEDDVEQDD